MATANGQAPRAVQTASGRQHFEVLDGLRGTAALMVVLYHLQGLTLGFRSEERLLPHAYLAVDFFFVLSGFVIAYAFDDRWRHGLGTWRFIGRRLVRLHPLVVLGVTIGLLGALLDPFAPPGHLGLSWAGVLGVFALGLLLIPGPDLAGRWEATHPLNDPTWSLLQEYIGSLAYALVLRRLSVLWLAALLVPSGLALGGCAVWLGSLDYGVAWEMAWMAPLRLFYPFIAGLLLYRLRAHWPRFRIGYGWLSLVLVACFAAPTWPEMAGWKLNGLYDGLAVLVLFPAVVMTGAHNQGGRILRSISREAGRLSYPLYITHMPLVLIWSHWVVRDQPPSGMVLTSGIGVVLAALLLAKIAADRWDAPLRSRLTRTIADQPALRAGDQASKWVAALASRVVTR